MLEVSRALNPQCEHREEDMRTVRLGRLFDAVFIHDGPRRSLCYLEWTSDPDPSDCTYQVDFAYLLREADGTVRVEGDRHRCGLFAVVQRA